MRTCNLSFIAKLFACGIFLWGGIATAQTTDRILAFESQITVDRDRTMYVAERFQIVNDAGVFDSGFHRRLWIKPINPQRVKVGSFQSVGAKVDDCIVSRTPQTSGHSACCADNAPLESDNSHRQAS